MGGHVARIGEMRNPLNIFSEKPDEKRPLGGPKRRWWKNSRMNHREIGWECVDWIQLP
jgi:hypothetical protein